MQDNATRFESWESNYANRMGLKAAVDYASSLGMHNIWSRIKDLADFMRKELDTISGLDIKDLGREKCGIVTFSVKGCKPGILKQKLHVLGINISTAPKENTLLDTIERQLDDLVRVSVHYYNTQEEILSLKIAIQEIMKTS